MSDQGTRVRGSGNRENVIILPLSPYGSDDNDPSSRMMTCPLCKGTGRDSGENYVGGEKIYRVCSYCNGSGKVTKRVVL